MSELKPCPFCGGEPSSRLDHDHSTAWIVECMAKPSCPIHDREIWGLTKDAAVIAWNRRTPEPAPQDNAEIVERVARAISKPLANMNGGCFKPDNGRSDRGDCADGDCYCARVSKHCARAAIRALATPIQGEI